MTRRSLAWLALCGLLVWTQAAVAQMTGSPAKAVELAVEPAQVTLAHAEASQRLLVSGRLADGSWRDLTASARFASANPAVAVVSPEGTVTPRGTGQTVIEVTAFDLSRSVPVTVQGAARRPVSFANDVMPIVAKAGRNRGACHVAASGKRGFKVSLRAYHPAADHLPLPRGTDGRRLNRHDPARSLLLLKPTGAVPHEG